MVKLNSYLDKIDLKIRLHGLSALLKKIHTLYYKTFKSNLNAVHISTYYNWVSGKTPIPIAYLTMLKNYDSTILEKAYKKFNYVSVGGPRCVLPRVMNTDLAYLIGALHGDGSMHRNRKYVTISGNSLEYFTKVINPLFKDIFKIKGGVLVIRKNKTEYYSLEIGSRAIHSFLSLFSPVGEKKGKLHIPEIIKLDKNLLRHYLSGLFDTDGCLTHVEKNRKQLYFTFLQSDKNFVEEVRTALISLNIDVNPTYLFLSPKTFEKNAPRTRKEWRIYIGSRKMLRKFLGIILLRHPEKAMRAKMMQTKLAS